MTEETKIEGAKFERFLQRVKPPLRAPTTRPVAVRTVPRFLSVSEFVKGERFTVVIPTARRTWWLVLSLAVVALWVVAVPVILGAASAGSFDARGMWSGPQFNPLMFALYLLPLLAITWAAWWWAFPRIRISADQQGIRIHDRAYEWDQANGFRLGYSIGGVERGDKQGPYDGLRFAYGGMYGDDLPFFVRRYYAPAYIMFLNDALKAVDPAKAAGGASDRIKPVMF